MNGPTLEPETEHEATVPSGIVRIIFDDFAILNDVPDFLSADHPFRPRHLLDGVRKKQEPAAAQRLKLLLYFTALHHDFIVPPARA